MPSGRPASLLQQAKKPILLAGVHLRAYGAIDAFRELAEALGCAVAVMPNAKGFFPEDHPQYVGIYWGEVSSPQSQAIVDWADLIVAAGAVFNDYTTVGWSAQPSRAAAHQRRAPDRCGCTTSNTPAWRWPSSCPIWPRRSNPMPRR